MPSARLLGYHFWSNYGVFSAAINLVSPLFVVGAKHGTVRDFNQGTLIGAMCRATGISLSEQPSGFSAAIDLVRPLFVVGVKHEAVPDFNQKTFFGA